MKATGIVRRIDDLGRVVIPMEIRRTMRIREGDPSCTLLLHRLKFKRGLGLRENTYSQKRSVSGQKCFSSDLTGYLRQRFLF